MKKLYGLIGYPVKHSLSALMHNAAFRYYEIDAEYRLFEVRTDDLKDFFSNFRKNNIYGINITIPHKTNSIQFMDDLSNEARLIGAINTVVLDDSRLTGHNTDGLGFIKSLKEDLKFNPKGKTAFILGAGGAARAVSFSLAKEAIRRLILVDIDEKKATDLALDLGKKTNIEAIAVEQDKTTIKELILNSDLLVNATPIGMKKEDPQLLPEDFLHKGLSILDLIYNPAETPLIKSAERVGIKAINGLGMLIYQGAESFQLWTAKKAPIEVMKKALS